MKNNNLLLLTIILAIISLFGCAKQIEQQKIDITEEVTSQEVTTLQTETEKADIVQSMINQSSVSTNSFDYKSLFEYTGQDKYLKVICDDMVKTLGEQFLPDNEKCVEIPTPFIVKVDDTNKDDIKVYGDFYIYGYNLDGTVFVNKNGGSFPGCYHLKDENGTLSVIDKEIAEDGSRFMPSLLKICGGDEELAKEVSNIGQSDEKEEKRVEYVEMYKKNKNINITAIKDFGWPIIIFDSASNNEFVFDFYKSYLQEIREEDVLNDMYERLENLKNKYLTAECIKAVDEATEEVGADQIIDAQDATDNMYNSLTVEEHDDGAFIVKMDMGDDSNRGIEVRLNNAEGKERKISSIKVLRNEFTD